LRLQRLAIARARHVVRPSPHRNNKVRAQQASCSTVPRVDGFYMQTSLSLSLTLMVSLSYELS
jgi:hypothetical protein